MRARAEQLAGALERSEAALQAAEGKLGAGAEARTALGAAKAVRAQLLEARAAAEAEAAAAAAAAAREEATAQQAAALTAERDEARAEAAGALAVAKDEAAAGAAREASLGRKADETTEWAAKRVESLQVL